MTEQTQPTDAEILDAADDFRSQYKHGGTTFDEFDALGFARAVLAKWGTPAGAGELVACTYGDNGYACCEGGPCQADVHNASITTPQPTQAQPVAVPLTAGEIKAMARKHPAEDLCSWSYSMGIADAEQHHGIKGADHG